LRSGVAYYHFFEDGTRLSFNLDDCVANVIPCEKVFGENIRKLPKNDRFCIVQTSTAEKYQAEYNALGSDEERDEWLEPMKGVKENGAKHAESFGRWGTIPASSIGKCGFRETGKEEEEEEEEGEGSEDAVEDSDEDN